MGFLSKGQKHNHKTRCAVTFLPPQCPSQYQEYDRVQVREHQLDKSHVLSLKGSSHECWRSWLLTLQGHSPLLTECSHWERCVKDQGKAEVTLVFKGRKKDLGNYRPWEGDGPTTPENYFQQEGKWQQSAWIYKEVICKFLRISTRELLWEKVTSSMDMGRVVNIAYLGLGNLLTLL